MGAWSRRLPGWLRLPAPPSPRLAFAIAAVVYGIVLAAFGMIYAPDSRTYSAAADQLIATGFDYATTVAESRSAYPPAMYALFATLVAVLKLLFGPFWGVAVGVLNVAAAAGTAAVLVGVTRRAMDGGTAAWCALGLFLTCFNIGLWVPFVMSDATFMFLSFLVFALVADRLLHGGRSWVPVFVLAVVVAFYRPTGAVLLPSAAWAFYLSRSRPGTGRRVAASLVALTAVAGTFLFAWFVQQPSRWPMEAFTRPLERTARFYAVGEVVSGRPETAHAPPVSVLDHVVIAGDRFLHFFAVTAADFSLSHNLVNAVFFVPAYALALWLVVAMVRQGDGLSQRQRDVFLAAATFVLVTAAFHGLLQIDFDWRYRLPILPHLVLLAAGGAAVLLRRRGVRA
jgi:hypothetical protein